MGTAFRIDPEAYYDAKALVYGLGLKPCALDSARKAGHLRSVRRAGRVLFRGRWVVDWLDGDDAGKPELAEAIGASA